jgi:O-antigen ligase
VVRSLTPASVDGTGARSAAGQTRAMPSALPFTGVFLFVYVMAVVLLGENPATAQLAVFAGFALAFVFAIEVFVRLKRFCFPVPLVFASLFLCYCTIQLIWAAGTVSVLTTLFQLLVLAVIIVNYVRFGGGLTAIECGFYISVMCTFIYNIVAHPIMVDGRIGSTLQNPNVYSFALIVGLMLAIRRILMVASNGNNRLVITIALILYSILSLYGIIYLSGSRKGMIISLVAFSMAILYWVWQQPIRRRVLLSAAIIVVFGSLGYTLYRSPQFSRLIDLSSFLSGQDMTGRSLGIRSSLLKDAVELWLQRPLTGWGLDQFRVVSGWSFYAHDNYVELLANNGIVGLLAFLMIYVSASISMVKSLRLTRDPILSAELFWALMMVGVLAAWDVGAVSYFSKMNWIALGMVIGVALRARHEILAASVVEGL